MTLGNIMSQMGMVPGPHLTERFAHGGEYGAPAPDPHLFYSYEPAPASHGHVASSKHHHGGGHKSNAAMSALTLLAFLFFLHILQQCLRDHMMAMSNTPVMIMSAGKEGEEIIAKSDGNKIDKYGVTKAESKQTDMEEEDKRKFMNEKVINTKYVSNHEELNRDQDLLMKINTADYTPKTNGQKYKTAIKTYGNRSIAFPGYVSAMDEY